MKKITRFMVLKRQMELLGPARFKQGLHLSLTGPEAGEISTLLGLGAPMSSLVGVEWHHATAMKARKRYPKLEIFEKDIRDVVYIVRGVLQSAFLDFCSLANEDSVGITRLIARECIKPGGVVALGFHIGREQSMQLYQGVLKRPKWAEAVAPSLSRAEYVSRQLKLQESGLALREWFFYRSRTDDWKGQPMGVVLCQKTERQLPLRVSHFDMSNEEFDRYIGEWKKAEAKTLFNLP